MYIMLGECIPVCVTVKMYKAKLQELCHQRKWGLPRYSAMKDGPDHMPSFKASVYVNRVTFTSGAFRSLKEAKNHAAMLAFFSFSSGTPPISIPFLGYVCFLGKLLSLVLFYFMWMMILRLRFMVMWSELSV